MNKRILITGASKGIGLALAKLFLEHDYHVIGTSRNGKIEGLIHPHLDVVKLDLSDSASIASAVKTIKENYTLDILINNAGIGPDLDTGLPEEKTFQQTFQVNVTGTVFFTESLLEIMREDGKVINISSMMGSLEKCRRSDSVAYRMSKSALNMYTKILSNRLKGKLKVAAVHPGWVRTTIAKANITEGRLSPEESAAKIFDFVTGNFETGTFWDIESQSVIGW
ncbi:MAG TPA: SDR family NAD(P)-dependent oxidoreductase [Paludibacter sp.]|nr:SDR family NAD(P)-dependent oxidoreductase [Paludibacter sp.]